MGVSGCEWVCVSESESGLVGSSVDENNTDDLLFEQSDLKHFIH